LIKPKLIVAMGRFAAQTLLNTDASIASLRGRVHRYAGVPCIVTYHPAYLLRSLPDKSKAWADLLFARKTMAALEGWWGSSARAKASRRSTSSRCALRLTRYQICTTVIVPATNRPKV